MTIENAPTLPFVSVIVPVYNGEQTVAQCVESLLAQDYPKDRLEIIFVDNKSKDRTLQILQPYAESGKILLLRETNVLNAYGARNAGVRVSKGDILAFTDADCEANPGWLRELVAGFHDPAIGCTAGEILPAKPNNVIEKYWDAEFLSQKRDVGKEIPGVRGGSCAFRKEIFDQVGLFREDFPSGGDSELSMRMVVGTKMKIGMSLTAIVRHHNVSTLRAFLKQSLRYGTHISKFTQSASNMLNRPLSLGRLAVISFTFLASFIKRLVLIGFGFVPQPHSLTLEDRDIYLFRPLLRIVNEWAVWWGHKFALKNPNLLR